MEKGVMVTARIPIEVTDKDIEKAKIGDSYKCVVAQAIARQVKDATNIDVDSQTIRFTRMGARYIYNTPYTVAGYVVAFDAGDDIHPFKFQLRDARKVGSRHKTRVGKHAQRHVNKVRRALPASTPPAEVKSAVKAAYSDAVEEARKMYPNEPLEARRANGTALPTPRVFKRKARAYGHRLLRINRAAAAAQPSK